MTVYHIGASTPGTTSHEVFLIGRVVLFKLKPGVSEAQIAELKSEAMNMVGVVPGLQKLDFGPPLAVTAHRAQGFDLGLVAVLDKSEDVLPYGEHPTHQKIHRLRESLCVDTLAYDMEF